MSHPRHSEAAFETVIEANLLANGYVADAVTGKINVQGEIA
jgi:hypothetical protein